MDDPTTCVTVVTGPLGAGKTTLLNRWLGQYAPGDVAVIVNEFGDVGIDGELLAERARVVVELTGGCVCCATPADLLRALVDLSTRPSPPRRIFVETSGVASPASVLRSITRGPAARSTRLDGVVTVIDATRVGRVRESLLCAEQVAYADVVVLSRADACTEEAIVEAEAAIAARNPAATLARAELGEVISGDLDALLARRGDDFAAPRVVVRSEAPAHDEGIESVSLTHEGAVDGDRLGEWIESELARFAGRLMRVKGIVAVDGVPERVVLQGVGEGIEVSFGAPWGGATPRSRLVLIGYGLDRAALAAGFARCSEAEGADGAEGAESVGVEVP